jgi:hypothetical protein
MFVFRKSRTPKESIHAGLPGLPEEAPADSEKDPQSWLQRIGAARERAWRARGLSPQARSLQGQEGRTRT